MSDLRKHKNCRRKQGCSCWFREFAICGADCIKGNQTSQNQKSEI